MPATRSYAYGWHPDRPHDSEHPPLPPDGQLSTAEAAGALGLYDAADVRLLIKAKRLPAFRDGGRWRLRNEDVAKLQGRLREKFRHLWCPWPVPEDHVCMVRVSLTPTMTYTTNRSPQYVRVGHGAWWYQYKYVPEPGKDIDGYFVSYIPCYRASQMKSAALPEAERGPRDVDPKYQDRAELSDLPSYGRWVPTGGAIRAN